MQQWSSRVKLAQRQCNSSVETHRRDNSQRIVCSTSGKATRTSASGLTTCVGATSSVPVALLLGEAKRHLCKPMQRRGRGWDCIIRQDTSAAAQLRKRPLPQHVALPGATGRHGRSSRARVAT